MTGGPLGRLAGPWPGLGLPFWLAAVACIVLYPFDFSGNHARHDPEAGALVFDGRSIAFSGSEVAAGASGESREASVLLWAREPKDPDWSSGTLVSFYVGSGRHPLIAGIRGRRLVLFDVTEPWEESWFLQMRSEEPLERGVEHLIGITLDARERAVFVDGREVLRAPRSRPGPPVLPSRIVLGSFPENHHLWRGSLRGFALFDRTLDGGEIAARGQRAREGGVSALAGDEGLVTLYAFDGGGHPFDQNLVAGGPPLVLPRALRGLPGSVLDWPGPYRSRPRASRLDLSGNVVLFLPIGWALGLCIRAPTRSRRLGQALLVVGAGFLFSLALETLQLFLPARVPGANDLASNTAGTALGVGLALLWRLWPGLRNRQAAAQKRGAPGP